MQRKKTRAELFGELVMSERAKWCRYAVRFGASESEADDVVSDSLTYLYSRPELDWSEKLMCLTIKCRAKNCRRGRSNKRIGLIEDLMPSHQRFIIKDHEMSVDDRMEYKELYAQALEEIEQLEEEKYVELLKMVCEHPNETVCAIGRKMGMSINTASGAMRRMRLYLNRESEYAKT